MKKLLIDFPDHLVDEHTSFLIQEKVFEFVDSRPAKYLKDHLIVYREDKKAAEAIKKMIDDWDLKSISFTPKEDTNKSKVKTIKEMIEFADDSLIFFSYESRDEDVGNVIALNLCSYSNHIFHKICRLDFSNTIY
ncbi:hypothetical protein [Oceanobacillus kimchii]|uniref:Uncharacterized protein n=1 Tax=Oceanobacillus kimchii TaxID=746691 RepID=A0ABQ5TNW0_9BACI|nr:hypothetical protein [Oceanobacillus kimchii]GLO66252.1 hypothetical protein MACH08_20360 [Oceanobacillus kimchii]